ncbi:hypothetical protein GCM10023185_13370 [Hymenobacter saemangeumensis]|uniref:Uncharacterized protein n=1 Tax=Hymenobacter saemangeumensis TaxID=1084522 RepID=A0ABP8I7N4_9BACT
MPFKEAIPVLREMADLLAQQDKEEAEKGKQKNEVREKRRKALMTAQQVLSDYLNTGAPAQHWQKGEQQALF